MTSLVDEPETFAARALAGFCSVHRGHVRLVNGGAVRATPTAAGKVAVVIGGGSGHYPAFAGYVGPGFADGAVAGDIFASPSAKSVINVARIAHRGGGVLLGFGNYAGDVLHFGAAAERLAAEGVDVRILPVTDDVASGPANTKELRRGVAGDIAVFKIAGAAAEAGMDIDEVERFAQLANARTVSFGVAFSGCTLPGAREPLFRIPSGKMAVGLGIHGEPGVAELPVPAAADLARLLVERLIAERPQDACGRVAVLLNGLGSTKQEELFVLWGGVEKALADAGLTVVAPEVGELVTSLDMAGCSLTLTFLDQGLEELWLAPADAPAFRRERDRPLAPANETLETDSLAQIPRSNAPSQAGGRCLAAAMARIADAMRSAEEDLGKLDALAGDGDHGQAMSRGATAAADTAARASEGGAGAATLLAWAADAWADRAGGASGALWGAALRAWSGALSDEAAVTSQRLVQGADAALGAVVRLGGARIGDKTLLDALAPFVATLSREAAAGRSLAPSWASAAEAASSAAEDTAKLIPKLGRARLHAVRSIGNRDAGATSLALAVKTVSDFLNNSDVNSF